MTQTEEFVSLRQSASDLGLPSPSDVRYAARNVVINGLRFHMLEWGEPGAPDMLLLHGANQTAHSWDLVSLVLAPQFHIVAIDQRGHGDSEWPRDAASSRHDMADDARQLIEQLDLQDPVIMGHSMGGGVTMTLLLRQPGIAKKAVLVDIGPETASEGRKQIRTFVRTAREFDSVDEYVERIAAYDPFRPREHIERTMRYNMMQRSDGKLVSKHSPFRFQTSPGQEGSGAPGVTLDEVARIDSPILITRGEQSNVLSPEAAQRFVQALPNGQLVTVPKCGHNVHTQNTPGFLEAVRPFLDAG
jgi:pimeloyl-ACP methyl ester carboxylesterase